MASSSKLEAIQIRNDVLSPGTKKTTFQLRVRKRMLMWHEDNQYPDGKTNCSKYAVDDSNPRKLTLNATYSTVRQDTNYTKT